MLSGTGLKSFQFLVFSFLVTPFVRDGSQILKQDLQDFFGDLQDCRGSVDVWSADPFWGRVKGQIAEGQ